MYTRNSTFTVDWHDNISIYSFYQTIRLLTDNGLLIDANKAPEAKRRLF